MSEPNTTPASIVPVVVTPPSIKETVLAQFKEAEATLIAMAAKYKDVAYDVGTPAGMRDAVAARADLRDNGRLAVTNAEKRIKGEVNDLKRVMAAETERLVAIVKPVEDAIDAQIQAETRRKADEKAERERKEAERTGAHLANITKIKGYVEAAEGKPLEAIENAIKVLNEMTFGPEWEEYVDTAIAARDGAVIGLNRLAGVERQRLENESLQRQLAEANARLAAAAPAPTNTTSPSHEAQKVADDSKTNSPPALVECAQAAITSVAPNVVPIAARPTAAPDNGPLINLGAINAMLAPISITADGLASLGFPHVSTEKSAKLYRERDFTRICEALIDHINLAEVKQAA